MGESDRIVEFFTREHGRISAVARGARKSRKRFGGRLDKFNLLEVFVTEKQPGVLGWLDEVRLIEAFPDMTQDLDKISMAESLLELSSRFSSAGPEGAAVFDRLLGSWRVIHGAELSQSGFYLDLLYLFCQQGMLAPLGSCAACGASAREGSFAPGEGGMLCRKCRPSGETVSNELVALFERLPRESGAEEIMALGLPQNAVELRSMARSALDWHAGGPLRALRVWEESLVNR